MYWPQKMLQCQWYYYKKLEKVLAFQHAQFNANKRVFLCEKSLKTLFYEQP